MHSNIPGRNKGPSKPKGDCFVCGYPDHFAKQCSKRNSAYCSKCKKRGHLPKACRSKPDKTATKERDPFASYSQYGKEEEKVLRNVLYVPNYDVNPLSVNRCVKFGHKFTFNKNGAKLMFHKSWSTSRSHRGQWFISSEDKLPKV